MEVEPSDAHADEHIAQPGEHRVEAGQHEGEQEMPGHACHREVRLIARAIGQPGSQEMAEHGRQQAPAGRGNQERPGAKAQQWRGGHEEEGVLGEDDRGWISEQRRNSACVCSALPDLFTEAADELLDLADLLLGPRGRFAQRPH